MNENDYRREVFRELATILVGDLDDERPQITIVELTDQTKVGPSPSVLSLTVVARIEGEPAVRPFAFKFREWEPYDDASPASMADGLSNLIRADVREEIATRLP